MAPTDTLQVTTTTPADIAAKATQARTDDAIRTLGGITLTDLDTVITDIRSLMNDHQQQADDLVNRNCTLVNTPGTIEHGLYRRAMASRDALFAPLLALQALHNNATRY